ncbi:hypothetical protein AK812_SmicGene6888 [Symbiodinium microadriaticum]|uniref:Uncharacterized protein n=1 Tax=Symbiodinium microadriaticum TaxID=2951 RepID=A0A1Q9EPZ9_SYMMI|nr:hypothetical protein AK812_SmicGene6888 [Symbiodinium microadriaticum]
MARAARATAMLAVFAFPLRTKPGKHCMPVLMCNRAYRRSGAARRDRDLDHRTSLSIRLILTPTYILTPSDKGTDLDTSVWALLVDCQGKFALSSTWLQGCHTREVISFGITAWAAGSICSMLSGDLAAYSSCVDARVVQEALELATLRVARGMTRRLSLLLRAGFVCWCAAVQRGREFRTLVPVLLESVSDVFEAHALRSEWSAWQQWWCHVGECRAADTEELLLLCLRAWRQSSVEQRHKRGVHLLCERYRHTRTKRKVLHLWQRRLRQLSLVIQSVHLWTASRATLWAQTVAMAWHGCVVRRRRSQVAAIRLLWQRRARLLSSWRLLLLRRLAGQGVAEEYSYLQVYPIPKAPDSEELPLEADEVKATFVRQSRSESELLHYRGLNRLVDVAEKWDGQVLCRQLASLGAPSQQPLLRMGLYACAEKAASGKSMSTRGVDQLESFLLRVGEKRPHQIMQSTIVPRQDSWKAARSRNTEVRQGLYRLGRWTKDPVFQQWKLPLGLVSQHVSLSHVVLGAPGGTSETVGDVRALWAAAGHGSDLMSLFAALQGCAAAVTQATKSAPIERIPGKNSYTVLYARTLSQLFETKASAKSREQRGALKWWHHVASEAPELS